MTKTAIGAWADIRWNDASIDTPLTSAYFSFMGINEDDDGSGDPAECDRAGVPDHDIFYFADGGIAEMQELMVAPSKGCQDDFIVMDYEVVYKEI